MDATTIYNTTRNRLLKEYDDAKMLFRATTQPFMSKLMFPWQVVQPVPAGAPTVAFAVLSAGTERDFFGFGLQSNAIQFTNLSQKPATEGDTNISNARNTNGQTDFIIESISATCAGYRTEYAAADARVAALALTDQRVIDAFLGKKYLVDPGTLINNPQASSPFNLEDPMFEGLKSVLSIKFTWDRGGFIPIGVLSQIPEGGARSLLKASGIPDTANRYKVPEGYAWRRKAQPDCDFVINAKVTDDVVCPINLVAPAGQGAVASTPLYIYQDVAMRVHGLGLTQIGNNAG